jgi:VanZ family protein
MKKSFFAIISAAYIFGIFFFADSAMINQISAYNPFSILHIPLYAILTTLLVLTLQGGQMPPSKQRYILASLVALIVAGMDEFYQSFIPSREASVTDIFLDVIGISLGIFFSWRILFWRGAGFFIKHKKR